MAISSADAGTVMDMRRTTTTATTGTGTDLASAYTSVVVVTDGVVTVATSAVTVDKPRGSAFCRPFLFAICLIPQLHSEKLQELGPWLVSAASLDQYLGLAALGSRPSCSK
jgi:hypothetical protein